MEITPRNIRNIIIYAAPKCAGYALNLISLPILTRLLSPSDFGIVVMSSLLPVVAANILSFGLGSSAQRFYFEYRGDRPRLAALFFSCQVFLLAMLIMSAAAMFLMKDTVASWFIRDRGYGDAVFIAFLTAFLGQCSNFYLLLYQGMEKASTFALFTVSQSVLTVAFNLILVWGLRMGAMGMIYGAFLGTACVFAVMAWHFNRSAAPRFEAGVLADAVKFGIQIVPKSLTGFVNRFFDKYMLNNLLSLSAVGIYNIGQNIGNVLFMLMNTVWSAVQPVCYREVFDKGASASQSAGRFFTVFAYLTLFPLAVFILFTREIVALIAPPSYYAAVDVIVLISLGIATNVFGMYVGVQYAYSKKAFWIFPVTVAGTLVNVAANILLIPRWGLNGGAISMVISYAATNILLTAVGQRLYRLRYEWPFIASFFALCALAAALSLCFRDIGTGWAATYAAKAAVIGLFFLAG